MLRDGTPVVLRLVTPEDKEMLAAGFERWSPESRYARFLAPKTSADRRRAALPDRDRSGERTSRSARSARTATARRPGRPRHRALHPAARRAARDRRGRDRGRRRGAGPRARQAAVPAARARRRPSAASSGFAARCSASNTSMATLIERITPERTIEVGERRDVDRDAAAERDADRTRRRRLPRTGGMYALLRAAGAERRRVDRGRASVVASQRVTHVRSRDALPSPGLGCRALARGLWR